MNKSLARLISSIIPNRALRHRVREILLSGLIGKTLKTYICSRKAERNRPFKHFLTIGTMAKNEGPYMQEWIEFHLLLGVEKFYIYDNESTDNTYEILKPYIDEGIVDYTLFEGTRMQKASVFNCVDKCKNETEWLAMIDMDEFIVPMKHQSIPDFLKTLPNNVSQLFIGWVLYGSNGHEEAPEGLVIEDFTSRANTSWLVKPIIRPRRFLDAPDPHHFTVINRSVDEENRAVLDPLKLLPKNDIIRINHYHCKSWEAYQRKHKRGDGWSGDGAHYTRGQFDHHNKNEVLDLSAAKYADAVKERIATRNKKHSEA